MADPNKPTGSPQEQAQQQQEAQKLPDNNRAQLEREKQDQEASRRTAQKQEAEKAQRIQQEEEERQQRKQGANEAARTIADAVQKVTAAAVAEVQKVDPGPTHDFIFTGTPGGRFHIRGSGFGPSGIVKMGERQLNTRAWGNNEIDGDLPADVQSGEVTVHVDSETRRTGYFKRA